MIAGLAISSALRPKNRFFKAYATTRHGMYVLSIEIEQKPIGIAVK
jgi:hypothetical protein